MKRFSLADFPIENKTVFLRVDFNVPIEKNKIVDNYKIKASLPTIKFLLKKKCKVVIATHLGRPNGEFVKELTTRPLLKELQKLLPKNKIIKFKDCIGKYIKEKIKKSEGGSIFFLENLRFYKEEEKNNPIFAHSLANLADAYVNDAFAVSHRKHASLDAITKFIPSIAGLLVEKEIQQLNKALQPKNPSVWILGGAKLEKIGLFEQAIKKADYILVGGALVFSFLKAKGISVGMSKVDIKSVKTARKILKKRNSKKIILAVDFLVADTFSRKAKVKVVKYNQMETNQIGLDLGPETIKLFKHYLRKAHTIVWNGPLGYFEWEQFAKSSKEIGRFISNLTATTICGGGETAEAVKKFHLEHKMTHVSTGGGATINYLSGKKMPAITALEKNHKKFRKKVKRMF
jgi:phosphoglycerate kinase